MGINWKIRFKNPVFIWQFVLAFILPILAYGGLTVQDLTTWSAVWDMLKMAMLNPYVLGLVLVNLWQTVNDPTTAGVTDSDRALNYDKPGGIE